jgi:hypothetical protein
LVVAGELEMKIKEMYIHKLFHRLAENTGSNWSWYKNLCPKWINLGKTPVSLQGVVRKARHKAPVHAKARI